MNSLSEKIKEEAQRQGFSLFGIAKPDPPKSLKKYRNWVEEGNHGEMAYLATERAFERRADPLLILPECKSILVLGIHYSPPAPSENSDAKIAAYALGMDYHDFFKPRLQALVQFLEKEMGQPIPNRWYTDTGPILERELAQRAGLGWIGKNSMLIHPKAGSYFILVEILLGISLEPSSAFEFDHCGSCTNCIVACPTSCILPNRTLDARQCLSYLTIEKKGEIPIELRPFVGEHVFGCDICQQVCPWNRFSPPEGDPSFHPATKEDQTKLVDELKLTPQEFNKKFKGSPIKRSKRRGYLRNIAIVLGNRKAIDTVSPLAALLEQEDEALVRQHAAWALGQIGSSTALASLHEAYDGEQDENVRWEIKLAIKAIR